MSIRSVFISVVLVSTFVTSFIPNAIATGFLDGYLLQTTCPQNEQSIEQQILGGAPGVALSEFRTYGFPYAAYAESSCNNDANVKTQFAAIAVVANLIFWTTHAVIAFSWWKVLEKLSSKHLWTRIAIFIYGMLYLYKWFLFLTDRVYYNPVSSQSEVNFGEILLAAPLVAYVLLALVRRK